MLGPRRAGVGVIGAPVAKAAVVTAAVTPGRRRFSGRLDERGHQGTTRCLALFSPSLEHGLLGARVETAPRHPTMPREGRAVMEDEIHG